MEYVITRSEELQHHGILGQKWGVRRYQNPDGTLTEAGLKRYNRTHPYQNPDGSLNEAGKKNLMKTAKSGKLEYGRLPDNELDMINNRFNKENMYKRNVENYEKSTFKYKLKEAVIARVKGKGGGGDGGGKGGKKGGKVGKILAMPLKRLISDAQAGSKGNKGGNKNDDDNEVEEEYKRGQRFIYGALNSNQKVSDFARDDRVNVGKNFFSKSAEEYMPQSQYANVWGSDKRNNSYRDPISAVYERNGRLSPQVKNAQRYTSNKRKKRAKHFDDDDSIVFAVTRIGQNELMHYGILGQKWGVRRYQNEDGTLTDEGRRRYMYYTDVNKGRRMSVFGKIRFGKEITAKTEADEDNRAKAALEIDKKVEKLNSELSGYDKMDSASKKEFGNKVLDAIKESDRFLGDPVNYTSKNPDVVKKYAEVSAKRDAFDNWIFDQVRTKSGESWRNKSVSSGHKSAMKEIEAAKKSGDKTRLKQAQHKLVSVGLHDIGFEDTEANRKRCWQYFFDDEYNWMT